MIEQEANNQETIKDFWLRLDNAAKMYPVILNKEFTTVFRMAVTLKERVNIRSFLKAAHSVEKRFPYYKVKLKKGFFWYYLEQNNMPVTVQPDDGELCRKFENHRDNGLLLRILVAGKTISIEFSHILTDGAGALEFLKSLIITYFSETGMNIPQDLEYFHPHKPVSSEEMEDSYHRYFQKNLPGRMNLPKSFHIPYKLKPSKRFQITSIALAMDQVKAKAKTYPVSMTVYLVAVYLYALQSIYKELSPAEKKKARKILRIQVPVNLRNIFPSKSMRNFTLFVLPEVDLRLGYYAFEEIVKKVHHYMELEKDAKMISRTISRNVGYEQNKTISSIPLVIKNPILKLQYYSLGANLYSGELTNMGKVDFSPAINRHIDSVVLIPPPPNKALKIDCAVIGFNNQLVLTFGNITESKAFEKRYKAILESHGIACRSENSIPAPA